MDLATERDEFPELAHDPVWQAYLDAPIGELETAEQRQMAAEATREIAARWLAGK